MKSFLNDQSKALGLRNNNPGNLVATDIGWQGKIEPAGRFERFSNLMFGIRACLKDLIHDIKAGKNTVRKLISEYAPITENNTAAYIKSVAASIDVTPDQKLTSINARFLLALARAIFKVELGPDHKHVADSDILEAIKNLGNLSDKTLTVSTDTNFFFKHVPKN